MKYPKLILPGFCKTDIEIEVEQEGLNVYGEPLETFKYKGKCNYQDSAKTELTADKKLITLSGVALFSGDICPEFPTISGGTATVNGVSRRIYEGKKHRNPDGTVNYTEVKLI